MATTSGNLVAGKAAVGGHGGGNGGRFDLQAKLALGAVTLGCAAALAFGGLPRNETARSQPQPAGQAAAGAGYGTDQVAWLEQFQVMPAAAPGNGHGTDQVTWLEQFQTAGPRTPAEVYGADQVAWLAQFQTAGLAVPSERHGDDQVTWLEQFQTTR